MSIRSELQSLLDWHSHVRFVRLQWLDLSGILRCRIFTVDHCKSTASAGRPLSLAPLAMICMVDGNPLDTYEASGTNLLTPVWDSLRLTNSSTDRKGRFQYATVMCTLTESSPKYFNKGSTRCPRSILYRTLDRAREEYGLSFRLGFEVEFIVAQRNSNGNLTQAEVNAGRNAVAGCQASHFRYVEESVCELQAMGIPVQQFHPEGYRGQYEISIAPLPPMEAVDAYVATRDAIRNVCARHGLVASMYPKTLDTHPASAAHTHISLEPKNHEANFVAGILGRLPALCALSMANVDSYLRREEAGQWVSWGTQSRDVPMRKVSPGHWEIRSADTTANPYLYLAAYISAGLLGIQNAEPLTWGDTQRWSSELLYDEMERLNISEMMPLSLHEALSKLEHESGGLKKVLGDIVPQYLHLKRKEAELVEGWNLEQRKKVFSDHF